MEPILKSANAIGTKKRFFIMININFSLQSSNFFDIELILNWMKMTLLMILSWTVRYDRLKLFFFAKILHVASLLLNSIEFGT